MKKYLYICILTILIPLLSSCINQKTQNANSTEDEIRRLESEIDSYEIRNQEFKDIVERMENENQELNERLIDYGLMMDQFVFLEDNIHVLQEVVEKQRESLPILVYEDDVIKEKILKAIDFSSEKVDLRDNELMLFAGIAGEVDKRQKEVLIEMSVYKKIEVREDIDYIRVMFADAENVNGKWQIVRFQRGN